jgi:hypothetical protein
MCRKRKAQSIIESSVAFVAGMIIVGAATGFFAWGIAHIPIRQVTYEVTRKMAATPSRQVNKRGATPMMRPALWPTYVVSPAGAISASY